MSDDIDHLDWEIDEGWVPLTQWVEKDGGWGVVTHFQIVPRSLSIDLEELPMRPRREFPIFAITLLVAVPFWLLAGYGLYCLVRG